MSDLFYRIVTDRAVAAAVVNHGLIWGFAMIAMMILLTLIRGSHTATTARAPNR